MYMYLNFNYLQSFPLKPWEPQKISGMFIVLQPIRCEMKPQKVMDKPQQESVVTWYETTSWSFLLWEIFNFHFVSLWKSYFLPQTITSHLTLSVQTPNYPAYWLKSECKLWKFTTVHVHIMGKSFSATKKYGSKTANHSQLTWPFELHVKQTQGNFACDWLSFPALRHTV